VVHLAKCECPRNFRPDQLPTLSAAGPLHVNLLEIAIQFHSNGAACEIPRIDNFREFIISQGFKDYWELIVSSQANVNGGWIGFGLTEAGAMKGADIVYYQTSVPSVLTDAYALDFVTPSRDDNQDWTLLTASNNGGWLTVEIARALDTQASKKFVFNLNELITDTTSDTLEQNANCCRWIAEINASMPTLSVTGPTGCPYRRRLVACHGRHPSNRCLGLLPIHGLPRPH
jgi:hypothetical protein